jgi:hypothetical protein
MNQLLNNFLNKNVSIKNLPRKHKVNKETKNQLILNKN